MRNAASKRKAAGFKWCLTDTTCDVELCLKQRIFVQPTALPLTAPARRRGAHESPNGLLVFFSLFKPFTASHVAGFRILGEAPR